MTPTTSTVDTPPKDNEAQVHHDWLQRLDQRSSAAYDILNHPGFKCRMEPHKATKVHLTIAQKVLDACLNNDLPTARRYCAYLVEQDNLDAWLKALCHAVLTTSTEDLRSKTLWIGTIIPDHHASCAYEVIARLLSHRSSSWRSWNDNAYTITLVFLTQVFWGLEGHSTKLKWDVLAKVAEDLSRKHQKNDPVGKENSPLTPSRGAQETVAKSEYVVMSADTKDVEDAMFNAKNIYVAREKVVEWELTTRRYICECCCEEARLLLQVIIFLRELRKCWQYNLDDTPPTIDETEFWPEYERCKEAQKNAAAKQLEIENRIAFHKAVWKVKCPVEWKRFEIETTALSTTRKIAKLHELMAVWEQQEREKTQRAFIKDQELGMERTIAEVEATWKSVHPCEWAAFEAEAIGMGIMARSNRAKALSRRWQRLQESAVSESHETLPKEARGPTENQAFEETELLAAEGGETRGLLVTGDSEQVPSAVSSAGPFLRLTTEVGTLPTQRPDSAIESPQHSLRESAPMSSCSFLRLTPEDGLPSTPKPQSVGTHCGLFLRLTPEAYIPPTTMQKSGMYCGSFLPLL